MVSCYILCKTRKWSKICNLMGSSVAQLVERSLPTPVVAVWIQSFPKCILNNYCQLHWKYKNKDKRGLDLAIFRKYLICNWYIFSTYFRFREMAVKWPILQVRVWACAEKWIRLNLPPSLRAFYFSGMEWIQMTPVASLSLSICWLF